MANVWKAVSTRADDQEVGEILSIFSEQIFRFIELLSIKTPNLLSVIFKHNIILI